MSSQQLELKKEEECKADFSPVVDLSAEPDVAPENIEEKEDILYEQRVRALRFDSNANEWKERGIGIFRILRQKDDKSKIRVLMRREKILKICLNHFILPEMTLVKNVGSSKSWMYFTPGDYSDGEAKMEKLCIMFKTDEQAEEFQKKFEEAVESVKALSGDETEKTTEETSEEKKTEE